MMNIRKTRNTGLVASAYSYLQKDFGPHVREAYANLKLAFRISSDKDFNLLLICDEARTLCDVSAIDGQLIPDEYDYESQNRSFNQTKFFPFSNFQALRRGLKYLKLAKSRADRPSLSSRGRGASSKKRQAVTD